MASPYLQLTLNRSPYSLTPLPGHLAQVCAGESSCRRLATHRLVVEGRGVQLLCDHHTVTWAREEGWVVTLASDHQAVA